MKTNKSFTKRIKITRTGKLKVRKAGQDHFNAKERGSTKGEKGRTQSLTMAKRARRQFLGVKIAKKVVKVAAVSQ